jgi:RNA polymerase sigma-70 factor (ECF subfamily)
MLTSEAPVASAQSEPEPTAGRIQEELWLLQAQQGDEAAFQALVNRFDRRLLYYLTRFTNNTDDALDAAQDVWVRVFRGLTKLRSPGGFRAWLYRIAHDSVVSRIRRQVREEEILERLSSEPDLATAQPDPMTEDPEQVHRALSALSPASREVLILRFFEGMTLDEIAHALRCNPGTVKSRLHYAKQALKQELENPHEQKQ